MINHDPHIIFNAPATIVFENTLSFDPTTSIGLKFETQMKFSKWRQFLPLKWHNKDFKVPNKKDTKSDFFRVCVCVYMCGVSECVYVCVWCK